MASDLEYARVGMNTTDLYAGMQQGGGRGALILGLVNEDGEKGDRF